MPLANRRKPADGPSVLAFTISDSDGARPTHWGVERPAGRRVRKRDPYSVSSGSGSGGASEGKDVWATHGTHAKHLKLASERLNQELKQLQDDVGNLCTSLASALQRFKKSTSTKHTSATTPPKAPVYLVKHNKALGKEQKKVRRAAIGLAQGLRGPLHQHRFTWAPELAMNIDSLWRQATCLRGSQTFAYASTCATEVKALLLTLPANIARARRLLRAERVALESFDI